MDIKELLLTAKTQDHEHFKRKLEELVRTDYKFHNLGHENQKTAMNIIYKHIDAIKNGIGISSYTAQQEVHHLYEKRLELKLTELDLKDIKEILGIFKK